jgi:glycosyltransferase involved in cell wall biosynthesis
MTLISVVLPVMNESFNIKPIYESIAKVIRDSGNEYQILFVCDPSSDGTEQEIKLLSINDQKVEGIFLAERAGQSEAIRAGYEHAVGDAVITMDADFQDPPEVISEMISAWKLGSLIVHSKRGDRTSDSLIYRVFTGVGYRGLAWLTNGKVRNNVGDFRLIDATIVPLVLKYKDPNPFWRGITSLSGISSAVLVYKRPSRRAGETKYSLRIGSPSIALRGMASFSNKPLELLQTIGFFSVLVSFFVIVSIFLLQIFVPTFPRGIPTIIALLAFFFSIQFVSTAIIATYLIVLIEQTRRRPNYILLPENNPKG